MERVEWENDWKDGGEQIAAGSGQEQGKYRLECWRSSVSCCLSGVQRKHSLNFMATAIILSSRPTPSGL